MTNPPDVKDFSIGDLILLKNNQFIALNKSAGMPVQPDQSEDKSLKELGEIYCKQTLYLIHRIDRPASGIVLFAKNPGAQREIQKQFEQKQVTKRYWAVVQKPLEPNSGTLTNHLLKKSKSNKSVVLDEATSESKVAELEYQTLGASDRYTWLEINLLTGRHHQIRAQLSHLGSPIKGDVKYGARRKNKDRSIHLHARSLQFKHHISKEAIELIASPPEADPIWKALQG